MIEMHGERDGRMNLFGAAEQVLEHERVGVLADDAGELDEDGGTGLGGALEEAVNLFEVADVERPEGVTAAGRTQKLDRGKTHGKRIGQGAADGNVAAGVPKF